MAERFTRLFSLPENLYAEGSPVVITAGALQKDNQTGKVFAQLKMRRVESKALKALKMTIIPLDTVGKPLGKAVEQQYLDLKAARDENFGHKVPLMLPDEATRGFSIQAAEFYFEDNSSLKIDGARWESLSSPRAIEESLPEPELCRQFRLKYGQDCSFSVCEDRDLWFCACGGLNRRGEKCHLCGRELDDLKNIDLEALKAERDARLEEERKEAEARRIKAAEKAKKGKKLALIIAPILVLAAVAAVLISGAVKKNNAYNEALALTEAGQYEAAIAAFTQLGDYKDSAAQIEKAELAILEEERKAVYDGAVGFFEAGAYAEAAADFEKLGDYSDSAQRLKEVYFYWALEQLEAGEDEAAYANLQQAGDYEDAKEYLAEFLILPVMQECKHSDGKTSAYYYEYTDSGELSAFYGEDQWGYEHRTEYYYGSDGRLTQAKRWNPNYLVNNEPSYYLVDFDPYGSPVRCEDTGSDHIEVRVIEYGENCRVFSVTCKHYQYSGRNTIPFNQNSAEFSFEDEDERYFIDPGSTTTALTLKAFESDTVYKKYSIYYLGTEYAIYETGSGELDEQGNIIKESVKQNPISEESTWKSYTCQNSYDEEGRLTEIKRIEDGTGLTEIYSYTYGHVYCPEAE